MECIHVKKSRYKRVWERYGIRKSQKPERWLWKSIHSIGSGQARPTGTHRGACVWQSVWMFDLRGHWLEQMQPNQKIWYIYCIYTRISNNSYSCEIGKSVPELIGKKSLVFYSRETSQKAAKYRFNSPQSPWLLRRTHCVSSGYFLFIFFRPIKRNPNNYRPVCGSVGGSIVSPLKLRTKKTQLCSLGGRMDKALFVVTDSPLCPSVNVSFTAPHTSTQLHTHTHTLPHTHLNVHTPEHTYTHAHTL